MLINNQTAIFIFNLFQILLHTSTSTEIIAKFPTLPTATTDYRAITRGDNYIQPITRIVGGQVVNPPSKYPFQAVLKYNGSQICGGSLIAKDLILTAAHCYSANSVEIGRFDLNNGNEKYHESLIREKVVHPDWNQSTMNYDFMILKMTDAIPDGSYDIVELDFENNNLKEGENLVVIGWGTLSSGGSSSPQLREATVNYVPSTDCSNAYGGGITSAMMCASAPGRDACQGDSGGPLLNAVTRKQVGVTSWGTGCASKDYPGVYARVSKVSSWVVSVMNGTYEPVGKPPNTTCEDLPQWKDAYNDDCKWYAENDPTCNLATCCADEDGITAASACCSCGGGSTGSGSSGQNPPVNTAPISGTCTDMAGWTDQEGFDCSWYEQFSPDSCNQWGSCCANGGYTANEACCICGGGKLEKFELGTLDQNFRHFGNMFDLVTKKTVSIYDVDIHTLISGRYIKVEIYTKEGTHDGFETDRDAWTGILGRKIFANGEGQRSPVGEFKPVKIARGIRQAFYVVLDTSYKRMYMIEAITGKVYSQNNDLIIFGGKASKYKFDKFVPDKAFSGYFRYMLEPQTQFKLPGVDDDNDHNEKPRDKDLRTDKRQQLPDKSNNHEGDDSNINTDKVNSGESSSRDLPERPPGHYRVKPRGKVNNNLRAR